MCVCACACVWGVGGPGETYPVAGASGGAVGVSVGGLQVHTLVQVAHLQRRTQGASPVRGSHFRGGGGGL